MDLADPHEPLGPTLSADRSSAAPSPPRSQSTHRARLLLCTSALFYGLVAMLVRLSAREGMSGGKISLLRFTVGLGLVVGLFCLRPGTYRPAGRYRLLFVRGLFGGISAVFYFLAIARIPTGTATFLNNLFPIFGIGFSAIFLRERPTIHLTLALLLVGAGVFLILGPNFSFHLGSGQMLGLLSGLAGGVAVTAIRALRSSVNAPTVFLSFSLGGVFVSLFTCGGAWASSPLAWIYALASGFAAFIAQITMTEAYGALAVPEAALWQMLTPISSFVFASFIGEPISASTALGVVLGLSGVVYGSQRGSRPVAQRV